MPVINNPRHTHPCTHPNCLDAAGNQRTFRAPFDVEQHIREHHDGEDGRIFSCPRCHRRFTRRWLVNRHLHDVHRENAGPGRGRRSRYVIDESARAAVPPAAQQPLPPFAPPSMASEPLPNSYATQVPYGVGLDTAGQQGSGLGFNDQGYGFASQQAPAPNLDINNATQPDSWPCRRVGCPFSFSEWQSLMTHYHSAHSVPASNECALAGCQHCQSTMGELMLDPGDRMLVPNDAFLDPVLTEQTQANNDTAVMQPAQGEQPADRLVDFEDYLRGEQEVTTGQHQNPTTDHSVQVSEEPFNFDVLVNLNTPAAFNRSYQPGAEDQHSSGAAIHPGAHSQACGITADSMEELMEADNAGRFPSTTL